MTLSRVLLDGAFNVTELVEILDVRQPTVSRNLKILGDAGLLVGRREGRLIFYAWRTDGGAAADSLRTFVVQHAPHADVDLGRRLQAVWDARRRRASTFFDTVDASDPAAAWLGSPDCVPFLLDGVAHGARVADLGTGNGRMLPGLLARAASVIAVDASPALLEQARRRVQRERLDGVDLRLGDLEHLPLSDGEVDTVVANMVLHHVPEPARALLEIRRVLRPGGTVLLGDFLPHDQEWMRERMADQWLGFELPELTHWLEAAGFEDVSLQSISGADPGALGVFVARARRADEVPSVP
jgi:ArsR family transcriptional regulator